MRPRDLRQWVCWRSEERDGKLTKVPYSPRSGTRARCDDSATWGTFDEARGAVRERGYDGVGFVFTANDPFCGVDLDGCVDPETGKVEPWAMEIVERIDSYTELSPSGRGLRVVVRAELPPIRRNLTFESPVALGWLHVYPVRLDYEARGIRSGR